ncbi:hypothetical protein LINGRAHAP2_LOCUS2334 [Linum grandiflorum]
MKAALVAQFIGPIPPMRVFAFMAERLWGYEGAIAISKLADGFFLLEFPSPALCEWVAARSWHIHHSTLILRPWVKGIQPLQLSNAGTPVWITLHDIPPHILYSDGISWLVSQIGQPLTSYVRDGLNVKLCVVLDANKSCPASISVLLEDDERVEIQVSAASVRNYVKPVAPTWRRKDPQVPGKSVVLESIHTVAAKDDNTPLTTVMPTIVVRRRESEVEPPTTDLANCLMPQMNPFSALEDVLTENVQRDAMSADPGETSEEPREVHTPIRDDESDDAILKCTPTPATFGDYLRKSGPVRPRKKGRGRGQGGGKSKYK